jgi:DNA polymerase-3 subunit gamma/tau
MSYQVLARKWRPRSFGDMVGQAHVVRALGNALDQDRLHHAYLFTGTRGVGKTTLARILAKALNCDGGVSSNPCCQCPSCREIDEGRFVDLLEVDAASRTRVDQTRELLDNVPFAPVKGRFKVYLIDEVHMFSTSSFNALLKTLEEPPPHVKFLLATTDPQKVPVTVLSRCLQFNLKRLVPEEIATQLAHILTVEGVPFEEPALALLARAADGSMRDGLSLLDQAIAFGGGRVGTEDIRAMLGTVGRDMSLNLLQALARMDAAALLQEVGRIHELTPDFGGLLQELLGFLHRIALFQQVPATLARDDPEREILEALARELTPEDVQLYYQIALMGQADLPLAPDPRTGMEMVLLRMLAFRPLEVAGQAVAPVVPPPSRDPGLAPGPGLAAPPPTFISTTTSGQVQPPSSGRAHPASAALAAAKRATAEAKPGQSAARTGQLTATPAHQPPAKSRVSPPLEDRYGTQVHPIPSAEGGGESHADLHDTLTDAPAPLPAAAKATIVVAPAPGAVATSPAAPTPPVPPLTNAEDWHGLVARLDLGGVASELAHNCELVSWDGQCLRLTLDRGSERLRVAATEERLRAALARLLGDDCRLDIQVARPEGETPSRRRAREGRERQRAAEEALAADLVTQALTTTFGARLIPGTVRPTG